jgi:hypothetical protein
MSLTSLRCHLVLVDAWTIQVTVCRRIRDLVRVVLSQFGWDNAPPSPSHKIVSKQWLSRILGTTIVTIQGEGLAENRGFVGSMLVLQVETDRNQKQSFVLKTSQPNVSRRFTGLGGVREALYYNSKYAQRATELGRIPKTYYSHGSRWLREMVILMENLQGAPGASRRIGVHQLMGNQIWGVEADTPKNINKLELLKAMYYHAAEIHAQFWMDKSLLKEGWMRNTSWFHGNCQHYWEWSMTAAHEGWLKVRTHAKLTYPQGFVQVLDSSFAHSNWFKLQEHLATAPFTLTHGDFHAANMIIQLPSSSDQTAENLLEGLKVFDWSEVGPWEPTTDLAQTVVSDLPKELFSEVEDVLKAYHTRIQLLGVKDYSWEDCRRRFGESGMERWIWIFGVMSSLFDISSTGLGQYFIDQMNAFRLQFCPNQTYFVLKTAGNVLPVGH